MPSSDSDTDAPEVISLSQAKKASKSSIEKEKIAEKIAKDKRKLINRQRDERLKKQKKQKRTKSVATGDNSSSADEDGMVDKDVLMRMRKAMLEADEEDEKKSDNFMDDDDEHVSSKPSKSIGKPNYLPDELFQSAVSESRISRRSKQDTPIEKPERRKRRKATGKDIVLGNKIIRTLPKLDQQLPSSKVLMPSSKVRKFINRNLAFKNSAKSRVQRRPVNIGVFSGNGPAPHFVRNK